MLSLPMPLTDELKLADWLELVALSSPDHNASYVDLERALRREAVFESDEDEEIERKIIDVSTELEYRAQAAGISYPFILVSVQKGTFRIRLRRVTHDA